ncbi:MAG: 16S rRNA (cytosine(1402)-N(4))-methyltransferase [Flavobacteriales bacterium]|nr:16S rRNA (cytosine(1402)-N(4))-methyltransferase [Flavobacteriales bacterium]
MMNKYHESVLLKESINALNIISDGVYVDVTFGGGGHSREILKHIKNGTLIAFDQDSDSLTNTIVTEKKFHIIHRNFRYIQDSLNTLGISKINGLIADLGVSSHQFSDNQRGFSINYDARIDMRMDNRSLTTGKFILNNYSKKNLNRIFRDHADFRNPNSISDQIINFRTNKEIETVFDLKSIFQASIPLKYQNKFFARLFQAIRIEVNDEVNSLKEMLDQTRNILVSSGRIVVISYHSVEDKVVKNFMKYGNLENSLQQDFFGNKLSQFKVLTKKPITPASTEINRNNKSRSAKMRVCEKI